MSAAEYPVYTTWYRVDYGTRYGKPRTEAKLPRKLKKKYGRLQAGAVEFSCELFDAIADPALTRDEAKRA